MKLIESYALSAGQAGLWWLGQASYIVRTAEFTVAIDPYLSDSAATGAPEFSRLYPPPFAPEELRADLIIITHNHLDHLDSETLKHYQHKSTTWFVAPWLTAKELLKVDIPEERIVGINAGETKSIGSVEVTGVFAIPTGADVLDTTGYLLKFANGRSVYHTSDTQFHPLVLEAAPRKPEVMLVPINGKWGNPGAEQAALFTAAVQPTYVMPNHYDMMALNAENPAIFEWFCTHKNLPSKCIIAERMEAFVWG